MRLKEKKLSAQALEPLSVAILRVLSGGITLSEQDLVPENMELFNERSKMLHDNFRSVFDLPSELSETDASLVVELTRTLDDATNQYIAHIVAHSIRQNLSKKDFIKLAEAVTNRYAVVMNSFPGEPASVDQQELDALAQSILDAVENKVKHTRNLKNIKRTLSLVLAVLILGAMFIRCARPPVEPIAGSIATDIDEEDGDALDESDAGDDDNPPTPTATPTKEPTPTPMPLPTGTAEPEHTATPTIQDTEDMEIIANDDALRAYYDKFVEFLFTSDAFVWDFDTNIDFEVFETQVGNVLLAKIAHGGVSYQGETYAEGTHLRFVSLSREVPYFASVEISQDVVNAAGGDGIVVDIAVDLATGETIAVDAQGNVLARVNNLVEWEAVFPVEFSTETLLVDETDLSLPENSGQVLTFFLPRSGVGAAFEQVGYFDEVPPEFQHYYDNLLSAAEFRARMEAEVGFDTPLASTEINSIDVETTLFYNCAVVLGVIEWDGA
ncbi:MAG: hypothetical protein WAU07_00945, partial [Microgenomates group bacterium]